MLRRRAVLLSLGVSGSVIIAVALVFWRTRTTTERGSEEKKLIELVERLPVPMAQQLEPPPPNDPSPAPTPLGQLPDHAEIPEPRTENFNLDPGALLRLSEEEMARLYVEITQVSTNPVRQHDPARAAAFLAKLKNASPFAEKNDKQLFETIVQSLERIRSYEGRELVGNFEGWFLEALFGGGLHASATEGTVKAVWPTVLDTIGCNLSGVERERVSAVVLEARHAVEAQHERYRNARRKRPLSGAFMELELQAFWPVFEDKLFAALSAPNAAVVDEFLNSLGLEKALPR